MSLASELSDAVRTAYVGLNKRLLDIDHAAAYLLLNRARFDKKTGDQIQFDIRYKRDLGGWYVPYDEFNTTREERIKKGLVDWKNAYVNVGIDGPTFAQNTGLSLASVIDKTSLSDLGGEKTEVLVNLLGDQMDSAIEDLKDIIGRAVYLDGSGDNGKAIDGFQNIIENNTSSYAGRAVGDLGVSPRDGSNWWASYVDTNSGTNRPLDLDLLATTIGDLWRGGRNRAEDLIGFMDHDLFNTLSLTVQGQQRFDSPALAEIGFKAIRWNMVDFVADENCPANKIYLINLQNMWMQIHPAVNFTFTGFKEFPKVDAIAGQILAMLNLVCNDRHRQGLIGDVASIIN